MARHLTQIERQRIREQYLGGKLSQAALAQQWGVSQKTISNVVKGARTAVRKTVPLFYYRSWDLFMTEAQLAECGLRPALPGVEYRGMVHASD